MANPLDTLSRNLAKNLVSLREKRGLSQNGLAKLSGVPRSTLNHLESGQGNPSLVILAKVSGALQISLEELLATPRATVKLIKAKDIPSRRQGTQGTTAIYRLLPDPIPGMEMDRMEYGPGDRKGGIPHVVGTKEYFTCIQGEMTVHVGGQKFRVEPGDVLAFPGDQPHSYQNTGTIRSLCLSVVVLAPIGF